MFPISESQRAIAITDPCALDQSLGEQGGDTAKTDLHLTSSNIPSYKVPALRQPGRVTPLMRGWCLTPASAHRQHPGLHPLALLCNTETTK